MCLQQLWSCVGSVHLMSSSMADADRTIAGKWCQSDKS